MDAPLDATTTVPATALPESDAPASPRDPAGHGLAAWVEDRRWRAALEGYACLVEPEREPPPPAGCVWEPWRLVRPAE